MAEEEAVPWQQMSAFVREAIIIREAAFVVGSTQDEKTHWQTHTHTHTIPPAPYQHFFSQDGNLGTRWQWKLEVRAS